MTINPLWGSYHTEHGNWCRTPICPMDQDARVERLTYALERISLGISGRAENPPHYKIEDKTDWELAKEALAFEGKLYERTNT